MRAHLIKRTTNAVFVTIKITSTEICLSSTMIKQAFIGLQENWWDENVVELSS